MDVLIGFVFGALFVMLALAIAGWRLKRKERIRAGWKEEFREGLESAIEGLPIESELVAPTADPGIEAVEIGLPIGEAGSMLAVSHGEEVIYHAWDRDKRQWTIVDLDQMLTTNSDA